MINNTHILLINLSNIKYTLDCVSDLISQDSPFDLTIFDQNSDEPGTQDHLSSIELQWPRKDSNLTIHRNNSLMPLNHVWNWFYHSSSSKYLCYLNNDVRITSNFISDSELVFSKESQVGITMHSTNHADYRSKTNLNYVLFDSLYRQGWDFTVRKESFRAIPHELHIFCGDDYIFHEIYAQGFKGAMILSSPIIHYQGMSHSKNPNIANQAAADVHFYRESLKRDCLTWYSEYSNCKPTFDMFLDK